MEMKCGDFMLMDKVGATSLVLGYGELRSLACEDGGAYLLVNIYW